MLFQKNKFDIFNILRGIAIFCVFWVHFMCGSKSVRPDILYPGFTPIPAWGAMWIFFIISGYLLGKGFFKGKYTFSFQGIKKFFINRFIRLVPYYLFFISIIFIFQDPLFFVSDIKRTIKIFLFTYDGTDGIVGIGALWFISIIVQFYIMTPIIYRLIKNLNKNKSIPLFIIAILAGGIRLFERYFGLNWYIYTYTLSLSNIDIFLCRVLLNKFTNAPDNNLKRYLRPISFFTLLFVIIFVAYDWLGIDMAMYNCFEYYFPSVYIIVTACVIYAFDYHDKEKIGSLSFYEIKRYPIRVFEALGVISFSFYLFQSNIQISVQKLFSNANYLDFIIYGFSLSLILSVAISTFMYFTVEKYFNKFKK